MSLLWAHDHVFVVTADGAVWSPGRLPYSAWRRYLDFFNEITVVARARHLDSVPAGFVRADGPQIRFDFSHGYRNPLQLVSRRGRMERVVEHEVRCARAVVARLPSELGLLALRQARICGKLMAAEVVASAYDSYRHRGDYASRLYAPISEFRMRRAVARSDAAIYVTESHLQSRYPNAGLVASASNVEIADRDPMVLQQRLQRIGECDMKVTLGFVGSLSVSYKGLDTALQALRSIRAACGGRIRLRVLGDGHQGPWRKCAERLGVLDIVHFDGVIPPHEVPSWLDRIDIYLHPSRTEGLPRSVIEAMSRACPVIAAAVGGNPELLPANRLHRPAKADELASLIMQMALDRQCMRDDAIRNIAISERYSRAELARRRSQFWMAFSALIRQ